MKKNDVITQAIEKYGTPGVTSRKFMARRLKLLHCFVCGEWYHLTHKCPGFKK